MEKSKKPYNSLKFEPDMYEIEKERIMDGSFKQNNNTEKDKAKGKVKIPYKINWDSDY